jgi:hypothetical protein
MAKTDVSKEHITFISRVKNKHPHRFMPVSLLGLLVHPKNRGYISPKRHLTSPYYTALYPRRQRTSNTTMVMKSDFTVATHNSENFEFGWHWVQISAWGPAFPKYYSYFSSATSFQCSDNTSNYTAAA